MTAREPTAAPPDWEAHYRRLVLRDLAFDFRVGFFLAYYRSFATPLTAAALVRSGEIQRNPAKRSYDTGILIHEIIAGGFDSPRGQAATDLLNRAHTGIAAPPEEYLHVLLALFVEPLRWNRRHGTHPLTASDEAASFAFYTELARRMHLTDMPATVADTLDFYDRFETTAVVPNPDSPVLFDATVQVLTGRLPRPLQPLTRPIIATLIGNRRMNDALGLRPPPPGFRSLVAVGLWLRARLARAPRTDSFRPGEAAERIYPGGYRIDQLGPDHLRKQ